MWVKKTEWKDMHRQLADALTKIEVLDKKVFDLQCAAQNVDTSINALDDRLSICERHIDGLEDDTSKQAMYIAKASDELHAVKDRLKDAEEELKLCRKVDMIPDEKPVTQQQKLDEWLGGEKGDW